MGRIKGSAMNKDSIFHEPGTGKGDKPRKQSDAEKYRQNYERIEWRKDGQKD